MMFEIELQLFGGRGGPSKGGGGGSVIVEGQPGLQPTNNTRVTKVGKAAFQDAYAEARKWIRDRNLTEDDKLTVRPESGDGKIMSLNSLRGIQALINSERKNVDRSLKLGVYDKKRAASNKMALNAVQRGLNQTYDIYKEIGVIK